METSFIFSKVNLIQSLQLIGFLVVSTITNFSWSYIGGRLAQTSEFPSVVWIEYGCTGNLVSPDSILVAGHCVTTFKNDNRHFKGQVIRIYNKPIAIGSNPIEATIKEVYIHSDWSDPIEKGVDFYTLILDSKIADAALIKLDRSIENISGLKVSELSYDDMTKQKVITVGGYGCEQMNVPTRDPKYKVAEKHLSSKNQKYFFVSHKDANGKTQSMGCEGDSGGPAFVFDQNGHIKQIGLNSRVTGDEKNGRLRVLHLKSIQSWLQELILKNQK